MTWFKVDDGFYDHPKVQALEDGPCESEAIKLWLKAGCWCARHLTDGRVPHAQVKRITGKASAAAELVRVGLWHKMDAGYEFHQWSDHQPTREEIEAKRRATAERVTRHRNGSRNALQTRPPNSVTNAIGNASPGPTRPDLDPPNPRELHRGAALRSWLQDCVRAAFMRANQPSQKAGDSQWDGACERVAEALAQGHFASAEKACQALAEAAVAAALKPGGKLGFALLQEPFVALPDPTPPEPTRESLRPRQQHPGAA